MKTYFFFLPKAFALCLGLAGMFPTQGFALSPDRFYSATAASIWLVHTFDDHGKPLSQGSAVVVGPETLLTNCHVLSKASGFVIKQGNRSASARLQYIDIERDMCQIISPGLTSPAVPLGDSDRLGIGQKIYTIGTPRGLEQSLSDGLISSLRKDASQRLVFIQITAPISHGSSGGGLFDEDGRLIGITSAGFSDGQNLNLAIPINWLRDLRERSTAALQKYQSENVQAGVVNVVKAGAVPSGIAAPPAPASSPAMSPMTPTTIRPIAVVPPAVVAEPPTTPVKAPPPAAQVVAGTSLAPAVQGVPASPPLRPTPSGYADLVNFGLLDRLGLHSKYQQFLESAYPRAFAIADGGGSWISWGKSPSPNSPAEPYLRVIHDCEKYYRKRCQLYAVDGDVVYRPDKK